MPKLKAPHNHKAVCLDGEQYPVQGRIVDIPNGVDIRPLLDHGFEVMTPDMEMPVDAIWPGQKPPLAHVE